MATTGAKNGLFQPFLHLSDDPRQARPNIGKTQKDRLVAGC
eukprot:COSAG02_NODE_55172_length_292_cov_0.611399_1_plen_40_part_10